MKRLSGYQIGIQQGDPVVFSDFADGGDMWTGTGQRERRKAVQFSEDFAEAPVVHVSISMWDMDNSGAARIDVTSENITENGFDIVFRTWGDTRVARARVAWLAIGAVHHDDDWRIY